MRHRREKTPLLERIKCRTLSPAASKRKRLYNTRRPARGRSNTINFGTLSLNSTTIAKKIDAHEITP